MCEMFYVCMYVRVSAVLDMAHKSAVLGRDSCGVKQNFLLAVHFVRRDGKNRNNKIEDA
jgi:hypothetical protein